MKTFSKFFVFLMLSTIMLLSSCSKDDEPKFNYDLNLLYGKWRITEMYTSNKWVDVTTYPGNLVMPPTYATFNSDGAYSGSGYFGTGSGKYVAIGSSITTYIDNEEYAKYDVISLNGTSCELNMSIGSSSIKIRCKKQ